MGIFQRIKNLFAAPAESQPVSLASDSPASERLAPDSPDRRDRSNRRAKPRRDTPPDTRVLIVDDSATIVALLRRMLRQNGYQTLEAGDAEEGIVLAREQRPDLIFLDIVLPGMNGFAALRLLRRDPLTRDIPIIMISGNEQATEEFYVHRIGADDFMKKPFSRAEVFARIERLAGPLGKLARIPAASANSEAADAATV